MYRKAFYIQKPVSNNAFSHEKRTNKRLFVPCIVTGSFDDLKIGDNVVFEDFDENGNLKSCFGLSHFLKTQFHGIPMYIFDNHNHAFYFWHEAREQGIIQDGATLVHIDQHSDMREPAFFLSPRESHDLEKVFHYTNQVLNVGNFIIPAQKTGLIDQVIQIRGEADLQGMNPAAPSAPPGLILDLDLDFFAPELNYINFQKTKEVILELSQHANLITIATSPFFMDQKLAIQKLHNLFL